MTKARAVFKTLVLFAFLSKSAAFTVYAGKEAFPTTDPGLFGNVMGRIYNLLYPAAIVYGILEIVLAGYKIMTSEGEPKKMSEAKEHLTNSIIGIIFVILAVVILRIIISSFLGSTI